MIQYVPMAYQFVKAVMPAASRNDDEVREELDAFHRNVTGRLSEMEEEIARLRARVREVESLAMGLQLWLWIGGGALFILVIVLLILVIVLG
jgi:uncharacterized coiled-coil DUF342 family protein